MTIENRLTTPPDALGALYFLPGQYLFKRIEEGREVAKALLSEQIALAFQNVRTDSGWLGRRILRYLEAPEGNYVLSSEPAGIRTVLVEDKSGDVSEIRLPLPSLILLGKGDEFYVWAATDRKVTNESKLSVAPLPNIGGDLSGKICFGSNEIPTASIDKTDEVWNIFWNTPFNGDQSNGKCNSEPNDVRKLLFRLAKKKAKRFPISELVQSTTTVEDVWRRVVENKTFSNF